MDLSDDDVYVIVDYEIFALSEKELKSSQPFMNQSLTT